VGSFYNNALTYTAPLDVPAGVTLTIDAGTVVKAWTGIGCPLYSCSLSVEGTLHISGTAGSPVAFTSVNDNSVGGSTGNGSPGIGEWAGITVSGSGSVNEAWATVEYATYPLTASTNGSIALTNDFFTNDIDGVGIVAPAPTLENNQATNIGSAPAESPINGGHVFPAFAVTSSTLNMGLISGNSASGGEPVVALSGTVVTSTMSAEPAPYLVGSFYNNALTYTAPLDVPAGVTLTIDAGTVVKAWTGGSCDDGNKASLCVEGVVDAQGWADDPVVFTSVNDNTVGGLTGSGPTTGEWYGIDISDAAGLDTIDYVQVSWAQTAFAVGQLDALQVDNSQFSNDQAAFAVAATTDISPLLGYLDCLPPYTSFVTGSGDWFGGEGYPGGSIDLSSILGLFIPGGLSKVWPLMSSLVPAVPVGDNTIPWTLFSCPQDFEIPIPISPVIVSLANAPLFCQYAEAGAPCGPMFSPNLTESKSRRADD
jgi:hypothetical protein